MKIAIAGLLATILLGAAVIAPDVSGDPGADSSSMPTESVSVSSTSVPESTDESLTADDSAASDTSVPASETMPDPDTSDAMSESELESEDEGEPVEDESEAAPDAEEAPSAEPAGVLLSDAFAIDLAGNQADSIMGYHGIVRDPGCVRAASVISLAECRGATEDESYFLTWEALNAALTAQAESGVEAANCTFENGTITIWV